LFAIKLSYFLSMIRCLLILICIITFDLKAQNNGEIEMDYARGYIMLHKEEVAHLISGHPRGFFLNYNFKADGKKEWHHAYNYPDWGINFQSINLGNEYLGNVLALGAHYNFYFLNRHLVLKIGQGLGYSTNPYDKETNFKNVAFGTRFMSNNLFSLTYKKQNIIDKIGLQAGFTLSHYSNARIKAPNSGINNVMLQVGLNYNFDKLTPDKSMMDSLKTINYKEKIKFNLVFRSGVSESPYAGTGQKQFYHIGFYADKRIGRKSIIQAGSDLFLSGYVKDIIRFYAVSFPEKPAYDANTDYKRVGIFIGHELCINKFSIEKQIGYYVYDPSKIELSTYQRIHLKHYFTPNIFVGMGLKTHMAKAEAAEFSIGVRL